MTVTEPPPGCRVLTAPNAGPMTGQGTNTYLLGTRRVTVIDPGPDDPVHLDAILRALGSGARVDRILVTHAHLDHSGLAPALSRATGAPVLAFGAARDGRSDRMAVLAGRLDLGGGEGIDESFAPAARLAHGHTIPTEVGTLTALHTPGHLSSHMCFAWAQGGAVFTGDTVMGWSTTLISPPDGSVGDFLRSLDLLMARPERCYLPGHGAEVADGPAEARRQAAHRRAREAQILDALSERPHSAPELVARLYADVAPHLHRAAARNVLAHLIELDAQGAIRLPDDAPATARIRLERRG